MGLDMNIGAVRKRANALGLIMTCPQDRQDVWRSQGKRVFCQLRYRDPLAKGPNGQGYWEMDLYEVDALLARIVAFNEAATENAAAAREADNDQFRAYASMT